MKKSLKISLGGVAFVVEDDAYAALESYIELLKEHLGATEESEEVIRDIEERAAELLTDILKGKEVVTLEMVTQVIEVLGKPEEIAGDDVDNESSASSNSKARRRLYRDSDNALIAGISSGMGAYFNIDTLVFRILFAVLIFANGLGLILYLVLWIAVPRAQTARQRMEMRGEEVNFSNLEKSIKNEFQNVKNNMEKNKFSETFEQFFRAMGRVFMAFGGVMAVVAKIIVAIVAVVLISVGLFGITVSFLSLFFGDALVSLLPNYYALSFGQLIASTFDLGSSLWVTIPTFFILAIPFTVIVIAGLRMVFKFTARLSAFLVTSATLWILAVLLLGSITFLQVRSFTIRENVTEKFEITLTDSTTRVLRVIGDEGFDDESFDFMQVFNTVDFTVIQSDGNKQIVGKPKISIAKSTTNRFEMAIIKKSRGGSRLLAKQNASKIIQKFTLVDNSLILAPYFMLQPNQKWRVQEVDIILYIPEGKGIYLEQNLESILNEEQEYLNAWPDEIVANTWIMRANTMEKQ
ncbi:MAG: PspC domain-containing protein [Tenuifilaceae bacterium]|nr:PspC domain-containing protein [Tenuifilaceae bacterium]